MAGEMLPLPITVAQRAELLDGTLLGDGLEWAEILTCATFMRAFRAEAGAVIFVEGDRLGRPWVVATGTVSVQKTDSEGKRKAIATVGGVCIQTR